MTKTDVVNEVAEKTGLSKRAANIAVNTVFESISKSLKDTGKFQAIGFGSFSVKKRPEKEGRNPATGETMHIPEKNIVKFKASSKLSGNVQ